MARANATCRGLLLLSVYLSPSPALPLCGQKDSQTSIRVIRELWKLWFLGTNLLSQALLLRDHGRIMSEGPA